MSDKKRDLTPRTPGEPVQPKSMPPQADDEQDLSIAEADVEMTATEARENLEARIEAEVVRRLKALQKVAPRDKKNPLLAATELPDASEIDANKITRAVMSKQGWVVPTPPTESDKNAQTMAMAMQAALAIKAAV